MRDEIKKYLHEKIIQTFNPMQNEYFEIFYRFYQETVLDPYLFIDLDQVRYPTLLGLRFTHKEKPMED